MANRIDNLSALDWDDSALIKAYNQGMSLRTKDLQKECNTAKENYKKTSRKKPEWREGDHCRAIYSGDGLWYEAKIISINGDMCIVDFLGYNDKAETELDSLDKSLGKKAIKKQKKEAKKTVAASDVDESVDDDAGNDTSEINNHTRNDYSEIQSPRMHHHHHTNARRGYRRNNETLMFDQSYNYPAADSTFYSAYPVVRYPEVTSTMPPYLPPCSEVTQNPTLNTMLTAWYMAGYYTGVHQAQRSAPHQHSCCHHQGHYH